LGDGLRREGTDEGGGKKVLKPWQQKEGGRRKKNACKAGKMGGTLGV